MSPSDWQRVKDLYEQALALPKFEQQSFVEALPESTVRNELIRLLAFDPEKTARIDRAPSDGGLIQSLGAGLFTGLSPGLVLLERFRIVRLAGRGGMGEVYEAEDLQLRQRIAIKTIRPQIATDERIRERFRREIALARQVTHPNVCRVFELHETVVAGQPLWFLTMEYLEGETLAAFLAREAPLTRARAFPIVEQMASALGAAHQAGVLHRDFKSANVFLTSDRTGALRVVVTDFGLARSNGGEDSQTTTGFGAGTPAYMAPEQIEGRASGPPADLYALGVVMYEMATGKPPYPGDSPMQVAVRKTKEPPVAPRSLEAAVDAKWESAILRCLEIDPADRFGSAGEVVDSFQRSTLLQLPRRRTRRWAAAAAVVAGLLAGGWWLGRKSGGGVEPPVPVANWYRDGLSALQEGSLATAQRAFQKVTQGAPAWPYGHARLAQVLDEMDQPDSARKAILQAIQHKPGWFADTRLIDAVQALIARDFRAAEAAFQQSMGSDAGRNPEAAIDLARCLDRADRPRDALVVLEQLLKTVPDHPAANLNRALLGIRGSAKAADVDAGFTRAVAGFEPLNRIEALAETRLQLSLWRYKQQKLAEARELAAASLQTARLAQSRWTEVRALFHLARLTREAGGEPGQYEPLSAEGIRLAKQERLWQPLLNGQIDLGIQLFSQGKLEAAIEHFTQVQRTATEYESQRAHARAGLWLGRCLLRKGAFADAERVLEQSRSSWRANGFERERLRTELDLTSVWERMGRDAEAGRSLDDIIRRVNDYGDYDLVYTAYYRQANYLRARGRFPEALAAWRQLSSEATRSGFFRDQFVSQMGVARALYNLGRFAEASAIVEKLGSIRSPDNLVLQRRLFAAHLQSEQGHYAEALRGYREILAEIDEKKITALRSEAVSGICIASIQAEPLAQAQRECAALNRTPGDGLTAAVNNFILADLALAAREYAEARSRADEARRYFTGVGNRDDALYSILIRGQAELRAGRPQELAVSTAEADRIFAEIKQSWGIPAAEQYLKRPFIQRRWSEIHRQQIGKELKQ